MRVVHPNCGDLDKMDNSWIIERLLEIQKLLDQSYEAVEYDFYTGIAKLDRLISDLRREECSSLMP